MEIDRSLEALLVSESSGVALDFLDHHVESLGSGMVGTGGSH